MSGLAIPDAIVYGWPYAALAIGLSILILSFIKPSPNLTDLQRQQGPNRLQNLGFLFTLGVPVYMFHQFEEHGIDVLGRRYAFLEFFCSTLHPSGVQCQFNEISILSINVGFVWVASTIGAIYGPREPIVGAAGCLAVPAINMFAHIIPAVATGHYNPGLLTSLVLFLPYTICGFYLLFSKRILSGLQILLVLVFFGAGPHL